MKFLIALFALVCASCSSNIYVVDEAGDPIQNATVVPLSRGFSWPRKATNQKGGVYVHQDIPTIEHIRVYKTGYETSHPVSYSLPKPITVVLKKRLGSQ